jgi:hypothetical protein
MRNTRDGRIHVVRLLRHANVHLSASTLRQERRDAVWDGPTGSQEFEYLLIMGENMRDAITATRDSEAYSPADLTAMLDWLEHEQQEWGLNHIILRAAELYSSVLIVASGQQNTPTPSR